jgi:hypothetical protein
MIAGRGEGVISTRESEEAPDSEGESSTGGIIAASEDSDAGDTDYPDGRCLFSSVLPG